jgi:hypothetical protein
MARVTTKQVLAEKALNETCGNQCVEWAIGMLESGHDANYLLRLAGMLPPYNHFEIADLRDRALNELGAHDISTFDAVTAYAVELLDSALRGDVDILHALARVNDLCIANDYQHNIMEFYLLYFAHSDLQLSDVQWYWDGADAENILSIIRDRATAFVESHSA